MRVFISYARVDKSLCVQIVDKLSAHDVWYDQRLYAGQHWWREILRRLDWCDVFIYLLSSDSVVSPYCMKELDIATKLGKAILPVLIDKSAAIPSRLEELQYVDMTGQLDVDNVSMLHNSLIIAVEEAQNEPRQKSPNKFKTSEIAIPLDPSDDMIGKAAQAFENGKYDQAILLFKQAEANGFESKFINIPKLLAAAEKAVQEQARAREAKREYVQIAKLFKYESMREFACEAFLKFHKVYPDYDPQNLKRLSVLPVLSVDNSIEDTILNDEILPLLHWCNIPAGKVKTSKIQSVSPQMADHATRVPAFWISKYPVTNCQFQTFIDAQDGYINPKWWQYSDYATAWFEEHSKPLQSRYEGDNRPRENVSWYEAVAFTKWLSHKTNLNITLPRIVQWQRAAQGDDNRFYPWGNIYNDKYCNTHESEIKSTTLVTQYEDGASPFGVYDMAGNVWEWCRDKLKGEEESFEYKRAVLGGSFVSPADRAQISFRYFLKPEVRYSSIGFRLVCLPRNTNLIEH